MVWMSPSHQTLSKRSGLGRLAAAFAASTLLTSAALAQSQAETEVQVQTEVTVDCAKTPEAEACVNLNAGTEATSEKPVPIEEPAADNEKTQPQEPEQATSDAPPTLEAESAGQAEAAEEVKPDAKQTEGAASSEQPKTSELPEPKAESAAETPSSELPQEKPVNEDSETQAAETEAAPPAPSAEPRPKALRTESNRSGTSEQPQERRQSSGGETRERERRRSSERDGRRGDEGPTLQFSLPIPNVDARVVIGTGADARVERDDDRRFRTPETERYVERMRNGGRRIIIVRPNGSRVITEEDRDGNILRRIRERPDGRQIVLIDNTRTERRERQRDRFDLPPLRVEVPRERYIVDGVRADREAYSRALTAAPVERVERAYSLNEIRDNERLRAKLRRVNLAVNFATGSAAIPRSQFDTLSRLGEAIEARLERNPEDVFLIEGHTDAVGDDISNLRLSDARAESVAYALTEYFDIPPENLIIQGYGEQYLKVRTQAASAENRRVSIRRITPLLRGNSDS
ncbi:OmpA family protein [Roseibium sp.]|uniref:OmpA family protein n=1 Tax=Roseibium sp. TaxID=1936156 RepID=UPI003A979921